MKAHRTCRTLAITIFILIIALTPVAGAASGEQTLNIEDLRADLSYGTIKNTVPSGEPVPVMVTDSSGAPVELADIMDGMSFLGKTDRDGMLILYIEGGSYLNIYAKKPGYKGSGIKTFIVMDSMTGGIDIAGSYRESILSEYGTGVAKRENTAIVKGDNFPVMNILITGAPDITSAINLIFSVERSMLYPVVDMDNGLFMIITAIMVIFVFILIGGTAWMSIRSVMSFVNVIRLVQRYNSEPENREDIKKDIVKSIMPRILTRFMH
ncbi:hypothetical protein CUJ83_03260 [Methanocella sp. CWC-04]|uniref:Uncharacterized protein n=1 Tax=Methanooceanicella nereidis TaxID=2052831 RepID=A0AAP2W5B8_9EURY|nr:NADH-quinone oxidoreductase subunit A [Methanocella sp. CWC-04]MCD1294012.1 hypothetical protein [Methanocella sp. CWC-04]